MIDYAVVIPAYNAAETLPELLPRVLEQSPRAVVVVDDGSTDDSGSIAGDLGAIVLRHEVNRGKGAALRTGFVRLLSEPAWEVVVTLDADLQHNPEDIPRFVQVYRESGADIVVGWRKKLGTSMPWPRRLSNLLTSALVSARTGQRIKDSQCGFRLITRSVLEHVRFDTDGYEAETEFLIRAARAGYRTAFVPIQTIYNTHRSYMTHGETTRRFLRVLLKEYS